MIIKTYDIISEHLSDNYNKAQTDLVNPSSLKFANVIPVHKKDEKTLRKYYRPVSLVPVQ